MNHSNLSTDGSNNNQDFQTFLQDYLSDLIQNPSSTERTILQNPFSSNYYINPLYQRARSLPLNLFVPENPYFNTRNLQQTEISGGSFPPSATNRHTDVVDIEWGNFMESMLQQHLPLSPRSMRPYLDRLLQRSLETTEKKYKMVLSESGKEQIKRLLFTIDQFKEQQFCPISQKEFQEGDEIAQLPCSHIFEPDNIMKWVEKENATCPVCRFKLKAIEKKKTSVNIDTEEEESDDEMPALEPVSPSFSTQENSEQTTSSATSSLPNTGMQLLVNSLRFLNQRGTRDPSANNIYPNQQRSNRTRRMGPRRFLPQIYNIIRNEEAIQEEEDLQSALMASLETYDQENKKAEEKSEEGEKETNEEELHVNDDFEEID